MGLLRGRSKRKEWTRRVSVHTVGAPDPCCNLLTDSSSSHNQAALAIAEPDLSSVSITFLSPRGLGGWKARGPGVSSPWHPGSQSQGGPLR